MPGNEPSSFLQGIWEVEKNQLFLTAFAYHCVGVRFLDWKNSLTKELPSRAQIPSITSI
jgi:hypothetical protein